MSVHIGSTEPGRREGAAASRRVLIVHGDVETRRTIARGLAYEMLEIVEAADARAAIDCLAADPIDLILLDMGGPDAAGIQLLRLLKGDSHTHAIPVIVIAGADEGDDVVDCLEAGADDYLSQPLHPVVLRIRANAALEKKQLRESEKALKERVDGSRRSHERATQKLVAAHKLEFVQLQETIKALRKQLDATTASAKSNVDAARASAAAELRQLRATIRALREQVDLLVGLQTGASGMGTPPQSAPNQLEQQASDGR
ncbi:MAG: response regulator transcription factor [Alphaproteobacteria bacterium]|nr:response regulator transcription factor [Alphaproteobacteria bacterium]